jgi:hypothetical protein
MHPHGATGAAPLPVEYPLQHALGMSSDRWDSLERSLGHPAYAPDALESSRSINAKFFALHDDLHDRNVPEREYQRR